MTRWYSSLCLFPKCLKVLRYYCSTGVTFSFYRKENWVTVRPRALHKGISDPELEMDLPIQNSVPSPPFHVLSHSQTMREPRGWPAASQRTRLPCQTAYLWAFKLPSAQERLNYIFSSLKHIRWCKSSCNRHATYIAPQIVVTMARFSNILYYFTSNLFVRKALPL